MCLLEINRDAKYSIYIPMGFWKPKLNYKWDLFISDLGWKIFAY